MESDEKIIKLNNIWYYTRDVAKLLESSKSGFEKEIRPHRKNLGKKMGKCWSNIQVKQILYILAPHITVIIE